MMDIFNNVSNECSRITATHYSSSFCGAIKLLHPALHTPIYNIYGFVRFADEIVDSFHAYDKASLLAQFKTETFAAIDRGISLNPILHSFQQTVHLYKINLQHIHSFFQSMEMDLHLGQHSLQTYQDYIYGSAEVVGLMCLQVFCKGNVHLYQQLAPAAKSLGAAFQKINFLRDLKADYEHLRRLYFPGLDLQHFSAEVKKQLEQQIANDLALAYNGILQLPTTARAGVLLAYQYYLSLLNKIKKEPPATLLQKRVRLADRYKAFLYFKTGLSNRLHLI